MLERLGPRALSNHLRVFADYLVFEFSSSAGGAHVNKVSEGGDTVSSWCEGENLCEWRLRVRGSEDVSGFFVRENLHQREKHSAVFHLIFSFVGPVVNLYKSQNGLSTSHCEGIGQNGRV